MSALRPRAPFAGAFGATVLLLSFVGSPYLAHASAMPDLKVTRLELVQRHIAAGEKVTIHETTKNVGSRSAGPSRTGYWLSKDETKSSKDRLLGGRRVGRLNPG